MTPPTSIDGTDITGATIDGQEVQEITVDGQTVFTALEITDGRVNSYNMEDEGSSGTLTDTIGTRDGTINGVTYETSVVKEGTHSLFSSGGTNNVTFSEDWPTGSFTVSGWVYPENDGGGARVFGERSSTHDIGIAISQNTSGQWSVWTRDGNNNFDYADFGSVDFNEWQMVTLVRDGSAGETRGYKNGNLGGIRFASGIQISFANPPRYIFNGEFGNGFAGYIDRHDVWNRALSDSEVADYYNLTE